MMNDADTREAWIFSLTNPDGIPAKMTCMDPTYAFFSYSTYGPTFGDGNHISVYFKANQNFTKSGSTYQPPPNGKQATVFFTGDQFFTVGELEVYKVI